MSDYKKIDPRNFPQALGMVAEAAEQFGLRSTPENKILLQDAQRHALEQGYSQAAVEDITGQFNGVALQEYPSGRSDKGRT